MKKLRAAIVGFGGMGQRHHRAYEGTPCEVTAIAEFFPERVPQHLPDFPSEHVYSHYADMMENEEIDVLSVVSNGPTHAEIVMAAAERGIPRIICEKPLATSLEEADRLIECVKRTGARVSVNHIRRWSSAYQKVRKLLDEGVFGELRHFYFHSGSTGLGNFVVHVFDLMRQLSGSEAAWVSGTLDQTGTPNPRGAQFVDPAGFGMVMFRNGMRAFVDSGEDTGVQYLFVLAGTHGRLIIDELNASWELRLRTEETRDAPLTRYGSDMALVPFDGGPHDIVELTRENIRELSGDGPLSCTVEDGMRSLELVMAFHESHESGNCRVELPLGEEARKRVVSIA
ncbi:MAG: Gfo/Idh/MocA family oxidoreductase [bacterium]|nr:Gfo/Idh/MocA family oxidoreductase [bacterium]